MSHIRNAATPGSVQPVDGLGHRPISSFESAGQEMEILGNVAALSAATQQVMEKRNPLFFSNPHILSLERHAEARLRTGLGRGFARATNFIPLTVADVPEAAKHYPIAFSASTPEIPIAIVGLESENYFIDGNGEWLERHYVPAYVRKYPFAFQESPSNGDLTLCVDEPALATESEPDGTKLYDGTNPSSLTQTAFEFCSAYQREFQLTRQMGEAMIRLQLLTPRHVDTQLANGRTTRFDGILMLDDAKFGALPARDILYFHQQGTLGVLYYILQSQSNWRRLLELANEREAPR